MYFGGEVLTFRNASGVGASAQAQGTGAPLLNLTTTKARSAIVAVNGDWNAISCASRTWSAGITETEYFYLASNYTIYGGHYSDSGSVGVKTVRLTAPVGQAFSMAAVAPREWPIWDLLDDIGICFNLSPKTVRTHSTSMLSPVVVDVPWAFI